jgi:hypothetical protein
MFIILHLFFKLLLLVKNILSFKKRLFYIFRGFINFWFEFIKLPYILVLQLLFFLLLYQKIIVKILKSRFRI